MKTKKLIEQNNQLRTQLNSENKKYYDDLLVYMRLRGGILYKDQQIEEILLIILEDMIDAQNNGLTATTYFGKNPKEVADTMMKEISPSSFMDKLKYILYIFGIYFLATVLPSLVSPTKSLDIGKLLIGFLFILILVKLTLYNVKRSIYQTIPKSRKVLLFFLLFFGVFSLMLFYILAPPIFLITVDGIMGIVFILLLIMVATYYCFKKGNELFKPFLPIIYIHGALAIAYRIPYIEKKLQSSNSLVVILLIISIILFYWLNYRQIKLANKDK